MSAPHEHEFTALWWHFGPYGRQDVHVHSCFTAGCDHVLIGCGRDCDGDAANHARDCLSARAASASQEPCAQATIRSFASIREALEVGGVDVEYRRGALEALTAAARVRTVGVHSGVRTTCECGS